ncbi:hypothetical protein BC830DRAFT_1102269 [Chytriomyces sp. MP71]|nr:hypothetical protein BC830DRAFT_1102269 [Chytriomyces sp. MP71]
MRRAPPPPPPRPPPPPPPVPVHGHGHAINSRFGPGPGGGAEAMNGNASALTGTRVPPPPPPPPSLPAGTNDAEALAEKFLASVVGGGGGGPEEGPAEQHSALGTATAATSGPTSSGTSGPTDDTDEKDEYFELFQAELRNQEDAAASAAAALVATLSAAPQKKTPFQLKKEAEEARRKKDEEDAARALKEFTASFDADASNEESVRLPRGFVAKTWIKGASTFVPTDPAATSSLFPDEGAVYKPHLKLLASQSSSSDVFMEGPAPPPPPGPPSLQIHSSSSSSSSSMSSKTTSILPTGPKKRQLDEFLQELKQNSTSSTHASSSSSVNSFSLSSHTANASWGSHDTGDKASTNLFVGNLHPTTNEQALLHCFGRFGPIASVKVMWPRSTEELERGRNTGFVGFMLRKDAEKAVKALDGYSLDGRELRVGWGKAVPIPDKPIFELNPETKALVSGLPFNAQIPPPPPGVRRPGGPPPRPEVRVCIPEDRATLARIHRTIEFVLLHGVAFEAALVEREKGHRDFAFLVDHTHPEHHYYRWKLYSLLHGDSKLAWPVKPFCMYDEGALWIPPPIPFDENGDVDNVDTDTATSDTDASSDSDSERKRRAKRRRQEVSTSSSRPGRGPSPKQYLDRHKKRLQILLRNLQNTRQSIGRVMVFALRHASTNPTEVAATILESLVHARTPLFPHKLARLHLVSDVLHNAGNPAVQAAWKYRGLFEKCLARTFRHFGECWRGVDARLRAEQWRRGVFGVLAVWERWNVFDPTFLDGLRGAFQEGAVGAPSGDQQQQQQQRGQLKDEKAKERIQESLAAGNEADDEDVDGVPIATAPSAPSGTDLQAQPSPQPQVEPKKLHGFKPIGFTPATSFVPATAPFVTKEVLPPQPAAPAVRKSRFAPIGGPQFVPATKDPVAPAVPLPPPAPLTQTPPTSVMSAVKKAKRVVAGAASVFQDDSDEDDE